MVSFTPDLPPPLGVTLTATGADFAIYAGSAESVQLCLFNAPEDDEGLPVAGAPLKERRIPLTNRIHGVWYAHVPGVRPGQRYGYRVDGPWRPDRGHRHNPAKLLIDPYAGAIDGDITWAPEVFGHTVDGNLWGSPDVRDNRDSADFVPRGVVVSREFDWQSDARTRVPWAETVLYEVPVTGATRGLDKVPEEIRGTYAALAHPAFIDHLKHIGVTSVELMPVHAFTAELHLAREGRPNYWGYNTLGFFAPHAAYAGTQDPQGVIDELKTAIRTLHQHGIEVILDVVYNHTCEQGIDGPTLSWRGLDNAAYYRIDERGYYVDVSGCGNSIDTRDPMVCRMILDSLRMWVTDYHVDGFRFDLAVVLGRGRYHDYDPGHPFLVALRTDPVLSRVKLIAEPWDCGVHGWRTGQLPPPFAEWNDRFRDAIRTFWLPDVATAASHGHGVRELATRLAGSQDLFGHDDRGPIASVNFTAAHDGFTLADATAYNWKHNEANGEHNRDGHGDNRSWNHGVEGETDDARVLAARRRSIRNLLATTLLSTGVPMLCGGDEMGRTQDGNNNAYCHDSELTWLPWTHEPWQRDLVETTAHLTRLRRSYRVLRQGTFFTSLPRPGDGRADVHWYGRYGEPMTSSAWEDPRCRVLQMLLVGEDLRAHSLLLLFHGKQERGPVTLPPLPDETRSYELLWDSSWERPGRGGRVAPGLTIDVEAATLQVYLVTGPV